MRDLGSRNGTYVNGELLDKRPGDMDREKAWEQRFKERNLKDGDELRIGVDKTAVFHVRIVMPAMCSQCGAWIPDDRKSGCERAAGVYQCADCQSLAEADKHPRPARACAAAAAT